MELRSCGHLHFIQAIEGGLVTKVLNVSRGRPTLSFKEVTDIYEHGDFMFSNDDIKAERACISAMERTVKTEPDASLCNADDGDDQRINNLDDNGFDNFTLKQFKECCKTRKRKHSQGLDSSKIIEDSSSLEDCSKEKMEANDSDFMETLSSWRSKLSKNMKTKKKKRIKCPTSTYTQEIMPVVIFEDIENGQEFPPSNEHSAARVEMSFEVPETDCLDRLDEYSDIVAKEEAEITYEWNLENELNYEWKEHVDLLPLRMVWPSNMNIAISNSELTSDRSPNFPAIEFESEECIIHPEFLDVSPQVISLVDDHDSDIYDNQPDGDTDNAVSPPNAATHKGLACLVNGFRDDSTFLSDCSNNKITAGAEVQAKPSSSIEASFNPAGGLVCSSDDSPEYKEKQSFASICDDEKGHANEPTDELTSWDEDKGSPKLHHPERLLSTRKAISPSSQDRLCKAMEHIDLSHQNNLKCRGKLNFGEQTDKKNGVTIGLDDMKAGFNDNSNKISVIPETFKRVSRPKGMSKIPHSSRTAAHLQCNSVQSCSKSAIAFSKQQMRDAECLAVKLTKQLKSMKDIVDDMLRSEFCLNTSLRYKVNEARMAVKNATRAEEATKRCLSFMARDCSRFCKIMTLADGGPSAPQDVVPKERKKIAFADEAGGRLCQVRIYEDDEVSLSESN